MHNDQIATGGLAIFRLIRMPLTATMRALPGLLAPWRMTTRAASRTPNTQFRQPGSVPTLGLAMLARKASAACFDTLCAHALCSNREDLLGGLGSSQAKRGRMKQGIPGLLG